jgi:endonuclease G, mitochondrial
MAKRTTNRTKIYGLTLRQWATLAVIIIAVVGFGCSFCYNFVRDRFAPVNQTANQTQPAPANSNRRQKRQPSGTALNTEQAAERYLKFGNPGNAAQSDANNLLMVNPYFALSYNRGRGTANWVAWTLMEADMGEVDRSNDFRSDDRLPKGFARIATNDYTGSGFDRGHLAPSADRTATREANSATFLMTNIAPQTGDLNRGVWENLESYSRKLAREGNDLYIIAGMYGGNGRIKNKITIPTNFWKIILVLPEGVENIAAVTPETRIIAVDMPNINGVKNDDWRKYRTTIRNIEQKTGLNLLSNLPVNVQNTLETKMDNN